MTARPSTTSSTARGLGAEHRRLRLVVLERDGWRCQLQIPGVCVGLADAADHIVPRVLGGQTTPANMRAACTPCNSSAGARLAGTRRRHPFFRAADSGDHAPAESLPAARPTEQV